MRLTELLLQTVMGFMRGRVGNLTLIELGAAEFKPHIVFARFRLESLLEKMNQVNPEADNYVDD